MKHEYLHLDVFTDRPFSGNQLAVFTDAVSLDAAQMQQVATEMAFPETTFVLAPERTDTDARVRIFTPARELPMAGHPTIGTAFALASEKRIRSGTSTVMLGLGVGPTEVSLEWNGTGLSFAWMKQPVPTFGAKPENIASLAAALGIDDADIRDSGLPVQEVSSGVPFLFVPLASRTAVNRAAVDRGRLQAFFRESGMTELPVFVFSLERGDDDATAFSRMFAPLFGISEDPATGGACGPLGAHLVHHGAIPAERASHIVSLQGVAMGRPSRIVINVAAKGRDVREVRVGGTSVVVGRGYIEMITPT